MRKRLKSKEAFTIIELLMVVAIIVILMSMLLPSLSSAKEFAKRASCLGNLRQIGLAVGGYAGDWSSYCLGAEEWFWAPGDNPSISRSGFGPSGLGTLYQNSYLKSPSVFYCPSLTEVRWKGARPYATWFSDKSNEWAYLAKDDSYGTYQHSTELPTSTPHGSVHPKRIHLLTSSAICIDRVKVSSKLPFNHGLQYFNCLMGDFSAHGYMDADKSIYIKASAGINETSLAEILEESSGKR